LAPLIFLNGTDSSRKPELFYGLKKHVVKTRSPRTRTSTMAVGGVLMLLPLLPLPMMMVALALVVK
jgi:hypothetical protein